ncbi:TetR/AcrR family transcriptional regulator [Actinomadura sp. ATCC 39365]
MSTTGRRPRADARRNYERLLAEADSAFREHGVDTSLESIARRAGVAIGTLYGHFSSRRALVGALLRERNEALFAYGDRLVALLEGPETLSSWVNAVIEHAAIYSGLADLLMNGLDDEASELHASCLRMTDISERLLAGARERGVVRSDVTGVDMFTLINAAAWVREQRSREDADRLVRFTIDGFTPR